MSKFDKLKFAFMLGVIAISGVSGCSSPSSKRTAFEILQNIGQQQCQRSLVSDCSKRQSFDDYQRQRSQGLQTPA
ncbi:MAG: hypothetical protein ABL885_07045, partial [Methylophilaceae bacterium]